LQVNTLNEFGFTPLMLACFHGDEPVVRHLVDAGASVNAETPPNSVFGDTQYWTALTYTSLAGNLPLAKYLIERGAYVEGGARLHEDRCTETPLQVATSYGNLEMVSLLLLHGADPFLSTTIKDTLCYSGTAQRGCYS
jgi:ankyrin repeat/BTB/POZ domain-containing protein 2